ncbi:MAG: bifunctional oligoribonuclease/PAP phosphatase NrnA [Gemmatimonadota bacterium]
MNGSTAAGARPGADTVAAVPQARREGLASVLAALRGAQRIVLTTHVNADGDGAGSEAAMDAWLRGLGKEVAIANGTPFPELFRHLLREGAEVPEPGSARFAEVCKRADLLLVLDTGEPSRIGRVAGAVAGVPVAVIDHHPPPATGFEGIVFQDATACATGELIRDLFVVAAVPTPWAAPIPEALYTAILTDTGSFRFSNTSPRAHAVAGDLLAQGVDPEAVYRRIYARVPLRRVHLLRHALGNLEVDGTLPITWITIERGIMEGLGADSDDLEGIVEHARSVDGTEVALLFRPTQGDGTKVSLRSSGAVDVNAVAREFGGGGHRKASGALMGAPLEEARARVLDAVRRAVRAGEGE